MGFGGDDDILQDFLVEAGEILEQLSEQLVDLENRPDDRELLNAIFRGFHTVKGGAGFLQLDAMVDCCHVTENLFDILRNGQAAVTPELMDVVLSALDTINAQFQQISQFEKPTPADPQLIASLEALVNGEPLASGSAPSESVSEETESTEGSQPVADTASHTADGEPPGEFSEQEYSELLDAISDDANNQYTDNANQTDTNSTTETSSANSDDITEDEFEALLDQLHGKGTGPGSKTTSTTAEQSSATENVNSAPAGNAKANTSAPTNTDSDEITESEFDALLDQLHGKGKGPGVTGAGAAKEDPNRCVL